MDIFQSIVALRATMPNTMHPPIQMFYARDLVSIRKGIEEKRAQVANVESNIATHGTGKYVRALLADAKRELNELIKAERIAVKGGAK